MTVDRRQFLCATMAMAVTGLHVPLIGASPVGANDRALKTLAYPGLLAILGAARVSAIGARYRETTPAERDADALRAAIATAGARDWIGSDDSGLDPAVLVARDFARGRTVLVEGWILSITEARQCALFSLLGT